MLLARDIQKGGMKFWVRFAEKYGSPWVIGKHPRGTAQGEIDLLLDSMEAMVEDAVAAILTIPPLKLRRPQARPTAAIFIRT